MLVAVADEESVQELVNIEQALLVVGVDRQKRGSYQLQCRLRSHRGLGGALERSHRGHDEVVVMVDGNAGEF